MSPIITRPNITQYESYYVLWSAFSFSGAQARPIFLYSADSNDRQMLEDHEVNAQSKRRLLARLPHEVLARLPVLVFDRIDYSTFSMITGSYPTVVPYFYEYPAIPKFEDDAGRLCPICLEELSDPHQHPRTFRNKLLVGALTCGHLFHEGCMRETFSKSNGSKCPLCKSQVDRLLICLLDKATGQIDQGGELLSCIFRRMWRGTAGEWGSGGWMTFTMIYSCEALSGGRHLHRLDALDVATEVQGQALQG